MGATGKCPTSELKKTAPRAPRMAMAMADDGWVYAHFLPGAFGNFARHRVYRNH